MRADEEGFETTDGGEKRTGSETVNIRSCATVNVDRRGGERRGKHVDGRDERRSKEDGKRARSARIAKSGGRARSARNGCAGGTRQRPPKECVDGWVS